MPLIYIVEDDLNIREIETFALRNSGFKVVDFEFAKAFYKNIAEKKPDLIILDVMLPDEDGLQILKKLRNSRETNKIPIIMVTARTTEMDKVKGLDYGADDYMTKPFGVMELISRVNALLRRSTFKKDDNKSFSLNNISIDNEKHAVYVNEDICELTFKEYNLLNLLIANTGIVLTRDQLMAKIWGTDFEGESRTLDMHIKTLRQKLGCAGSSIKTIRNVGYIIE